MQKKHKKIKRVGSVIYFFIIKLTATKVYQFAVVIDPWLSGGYMRGAEGQNLGIGG